MQFLTESHQKDAELIVRRPGSSHPLHFTLSPQLIDAPSVDRAYMLSPGIGYIRIASFDPKTANLFKDAIEKLGGANLKGLVLDLRNNTGGVVQTALESAAFFLKPGQRLLTAHGRSLEGQQEMDVPKNATPYTFPLAVLVNEKTASAAEIVTGALQDHDRATIVGETTYGKGLVQSVMPLSEERAIALTTAFYYTPSGRSIQKPLREGRSAIRFARTLLNRQRAQGAWRRRHSSRRDSHARPAQPAEGRARSERRHHVIRHRIHAET